MGLIPAGDYQAAASVQAVRGESEPRGRDLSAGELLGQSSRVAVISSSRFSSETSQPAASPPPQLRVVPVHRSASGASGSRLHESIQTCH